MGITASSACSNNNKSKKGGNNNMNDNYNNTSKKTGIYIRKAHHAGSWYQNSSTDLDQTLECLLNRAETKTNRQHRLRSLICPHAGFSYSGPTAAYSYHALQEELSDPQSPIRSVLVLHPAHHVYLQGCAVSGAMELETPLGNLPVDDNLRQELLRLPNNHFSVMDSQTDEEEHSGEMQYPFVAKCLRAAKNPIRVLPIMCGALSQEQEAFYGNILSTYILHRPDILTIVSSDFCHWGSRFRYQPMPDAGGKMPIHKFIEQMDQEGMDLISMQQPGAFATYLKRTRNTICGRHAIGVWLHAIQQPQGSNVEDKNNGGLEVTFVKYAQSSPAQSLRDSSVSYASAVVTARDPK